jgi:hypothetical protein
MSTYEQGPGFTGEFDTGSPSLEHIYNEILIRHNEIAEEFGVLKHIKIDDESQFKLQTPEAGNLISLRIFKKKSPDQEIQLGYYDPRYCEYELYPEIVQIGYLKPLLAEACELQRRSINRFENLKDDNRKRTSFEHPAIQELHRKHNAIFQALDLDVALMDGHNNKSDMTREEEIRIDSSTHVSVRIKTTPVSNIPDGNLEINLLGAHFEFNGVKKRHHGEKKFIVGQRSSDESGVYYQPVEPNDYFDDKQMYHLNEMALDLLVLRDQIPDFSAAKGGIIIRPIIKDKPPKELPPVIESD